MGKFLKSGKVVILLKGRYAGHKAVIVKNFDKGTAARPYGHCIVAGVERCPLKVTKTMGKRKVEKRTRVKPFIKRVNFTHLMPTRYGFDIEQLKTTVIPSSLDKSRRASTKREVRKMFQDRYRAGKNRWFFTKLQF